MNFANDFDTVNMIVEEIGCGAGVAADLLILAGGNPYLVIAASKESNSLNQCKARIIDERIRREKDDGPFLP